MRLFLTTILTILCLLTATAQDIIVKVDGDTLKVYDLKINAKFITYREKPGKESPSRRIGRAKVLSVKKRNCKSVTISKPAPAPVIVQQLAENSKSPPKSRKAKLSAKHRPIMRSLLLLIIKITVATAIKSRKAKQPVVPLP